MLNGEFEASDIRERTVIRLNSGLRTVKVLSVDEDVENLRWQGDLVEIPELWKDLLRSSILLYQKCLAVNKETSYDEESDSTALCIPGIGWCAIHGKWVQFLFEDGSRMEINMEGQGILYCDTNRRKEKWRLNQDQLPTYIKERLDRCMAFRDVE